jgi:3-oxoacyl-[acyl-carrier protein] reductase
MVARGQGKIINISTSERTMVRPCFSPYGPSKAFVEACSRIWAGELKGTGVSVNVLSPGGAVDTAADVTGVQTAGKAFLPASVMIAPVAWLSSTASDEINGDRFVANLWRDDLPLHERIAAARQNLP